MTIALAGLVLAACGGDDKGPRPAGAPAEEIAQLMRDFERATARRDFRTICEDLLATEVRERAGGRRCPAVLRRNAAGVASPRIKLLGITLRRGAATARVLTTSRGQDPAIDVVELVREKDGYRIASLSRAP
jgi:hypothetical protein